MSKIADAALPSSRPNVLALMSAATVLGFGVARLAIIMTTPELPSSSPLVLAAAGPPQHDEASAIIQTTPAARVWASAFGSAPPRAVEPVPDFPELDAHDLDTLDPEAIIDATTDYRLRGRVTAPEGGWALIDDGAEELLVRVGDILPGGETVVSIGIGGVTLDGDHGPQVLAFRDDDFAPHSSSDVEGDEFRPSSWDDMEPTDQFFPEADLDEVAW